MIGGIFQPCVMTDGHPGILLLDQGTVFKTRRNTCGNLDNGGRPRRQYWSLPVLARWVYWKIYSQLWQFRWENVDCSLNCGVITIFSDKFRMHLLGTGPLRKVFKDYWCRPQQRSSPVASAAMAQKGDGWPSWIWINNGSTLDVKDLKWKKTYIYILSDFGQVGKYSAIRFICVV